MVDETVTAAAIEATKAGDPATRNAAQVAAERAGTAALTFLPAVHVSQETAYVIEDYPYGFRLRCTKRVWIERNKRGARLMEQTSNPKVAGLRWNKPKAGQYAAVLHLAIERETGHVVSRGLGKYTSEAARIDDVEALMGHVLTDACRATIAEARCVSRALSRVTWTVAASPVGAIDLGAVMRGDPVAKAKMAEESARQEARKRDEGRMLGALVANERAAMSSAPVPFPQLGTAAAPPG